MSAAVNARRARTGADPHIPAAVLHHAGATVTVRIRTVAAKTDAARIKTGAEKAATDAVREAAGAVQTVYRHS